MPIGQGDVLDLDPFHADAAGLLGGFVDDVFEVGIDLLALGQQLVHVALPDHRAQRRLGDLGDGVGVVLHVAGGCTEGARKIAGGNCLRIRRPPRPGRS